jgi:tetratricopeptide (TPR) repeat protein
MDILALAALFSYTASLLADPLNGGIKHGVDLVALAKLFEDLGQLETARQVYEHSLEHDLPDEVYAEAVRRLAGIYRRDGDPLAAIALWQDAADRGHIYAHVELAKFCEHQRRDYAEALYWTQAALDLIGQPTCPRPVRIKWQGELKHRLARLQRKLATP